MTSNLPGTPSAHGGAPEPVRVSQQPDRDEEGALEQFGYKQELRRAITPFEMFGVSFSTTSITTGLFLMVGPTLTTAGPLGLWLVLIAALPTFAVVATYAAMARRVPVAGLEYQWGMRIAGRAGGLIAGWLGFAAALIAVIAVAYVLASTVLPALFSYESSATTDTWTTIGVVAALTVILIVSVRVPAKITKYATITEIAVVFGLTLLLFVVGALRGNLVGSSLLFSHQGLPSKGYFSFGGLKAVGAFWVAITVVFFGAGTTGWQNAASAVEEGAHPARSAPRAMYRTVIIATVLETLFLIAFVLNISPSALAHIASSPTSLADVMSSVLGVAVAKILLAFVGFNILTCALMLYYQTTRYVYAMARDGNFIGSKAFQLSRVHRSLRTPINATLLVVVLLAIILAYFGTRPDAYINLISAASLSLVAVYLAGVVLFAVRGHSLTPLVPERLNALGRVARWIVVAVAVVWLLFILWTFHQAEFKSVWVYFGGICGVGALFVVFTEVARVRRSKVTEIGIDGPSL